MDHMSFGKIEKIFGRLYETLREENSENAPNSYVWFARTRKELAEKSDQDLSEKSHESIGSGATIGWGIDAHLFYLVRFGSRATEAQITEWFSDSMFAAEEV